MNDDEQHDMNAGEPLLVVLVIVALLISILHLCGCGVTSEDIAIQQNLWEEQQAALREQERLQDSKQDLLQELGMLIPRGEKSLRRLRAMVDRGLTEEDTPEVDRHVSVLEGINFDLSRIHGELIDAEAIDAEILNAAWLRAGEARSVLDDLDNKTWFADFTETVLGTVVEGFKDALPISLPESGDDYGVLDGVKDVAPWTVTALLAFLAQRKARQVGGALMGGARNIIDTARRMLPAARAELDARLPVQSPPAPDSQPPVTTKGE